PLRRDQYILFQVACAEFAGHRWFDGEDHILLHGLLSLLPIPVRPPWTQQRPNLVSAPSQHLPYGMLVLREPSPDDQSSSSSSNLVARNTSLQNRESRVSRLSRRLEHARHSLRNDSGSDEIVPLNIAAVAVVLDAKVQLDKISPPDPSTIVADVAHWIVAYQHGGTAINSPGRAELLLLEELVRKFVDLPVLLSRLDDILKRVIGLLTFSNRFLDQLNLSRHQSSPQRNGQVLPRDQPFRIVP